MAALAAAAEPGSRDHPDHRRRPAAGGPLDAPDFETASPEALVAHHGRAADAFARFGNGWSIWLDQWRVRSPGYLPACDFGGCLAAQLVDASRRRQFNERPGRCSRTRLHRRALPAAAPRCAAGLDDGSGRFAGCGQRQLLQREHRRPVRPAGAYAARRHHPARRRARLLSRGLGHLSSPSGPCSRPACWRRSWQRASGTRHPRLRIDGRHLATVEVRNFGSPSPLTVEGLHELPVRVPLDHGLARPRPGRAAQGDPRGPQALGDQAEGSGRDPDRDRDQEPVRRPHRPRGRPRPGPARCACRASWPPRPYAWPMPTSMSGASTATRPTSGRRRWPPAQRARARGPRSPRSTMSMAPLATCRAT